MTVNNLNSEQITTREEYKETALDAPEKIKQNENLEQEQIDQGKGTEPKKERIRIRLIPIWLRLVLLAVFMLISLTAGALVGYCVLGGGKATDVFKASTWTHIHDLVDKK